MTLLSRAYLLPIWLLCTSVQAAPFGQAQIQGIIHGQPLTLKTCAHDAGAVCSIRWQGREFVNDHDHGRQFQTAFQIDGQGEDNNPTEAGSESDGNRPKPSSSRLISLTTNGQVIGKNWLGWDRIQLGDTLNAETQMAYWRPVQGRKLSDYRVVRQIVISPSERPNWIHYQTTIKTTAAPIEQLAIEALTGYMPRDFNQFFTLDANGQRQPIALDRPNSEQPSPLIFSTSDGRHAIGVKAESGWQQQAPSYGFFRFPSRSRNATVKWNVVYRYQPTAIQPLTGQSIPHTIWLTIGTLQQVTDTMQSQP